MAKGGARPGAGRPTALTENTRALVMDKCWALLSVYLDDPNQRMKDKIDVAKLLASRSVPQEVKNTIETDKPIVFSWEK